MESANKRRRLRKANDNGRVIPISDNDWSSQQTGTSNGELTANHIEGRGFALNSNRLNLPVVDIRRLRRQLLVSQPQSISIVSGRTPYGSTKKHKQHNCSA